MIYSFDMENAIKYGDREAIMLANFEFWLAKNKAENKNQQEGRTWTFNTIAGFKKLFPCWSEKQIRRIIDSLLSQGVLVKGNFNQKGYDRTSWYALADESALLLNCPNGQMEVPKRANAIAQKGEPIPDKKLKIENKDIKELYPTLNLDAWDEFLQHRKDIKQPVTKAAQTKLLNKLASLSHEQQQDTVDKSIENNWRGLFPEKGGNNAARFNTDKQSSYLDELAALPD